MMLFSRSTAYGVEAQGTNRDHARGAGAVAPVALGVAAATAASQLREDRNEDPPTRALVGRKKRGTGLLASAEVVPAGAPQVKGQGPQPNCRWTLFRRRQ